MTQPERPPIGWGRALKILGVVLGLGVVAFVVLYIVLFELYAHGSGGT